MRVTSLAESNPCVAIRLVRWDAQTCRQTVLNIRNNIAWRSEGMDARRSRCFTVGDISADHDIIAWDAYGCVEKHYFIGTLVLCKLSRMPAAVVASVRMSIARPFSFVSLCFCKIASSCAHGSCSGPCDGARPDLAQRRRGGHGPCLIWLPPSAMWSYLWQTRAMRAPCRASLICCSTACCSVVLSVIWSRLCYTPWRAKQSVQSQTVCMVCERDHPKPRHKIDLGLIGSHCFTLGRWTCE